MFYFGIKSKQIWFIRGPSQQYPELFCPYMVCFQVHNHWFCIRFHPDWDLPSGNDIIFYLDLTGFTRDLSEIWNLLGFVGICADLLGFVPPLEHFYYGSDYNFTRPWVNRNRPILVEIGQGMVSWAHANITWTLWKKIYQEPP